MKKKPEAEKENSERWMLTYLDMITLLFVTFVVLYAMSNIDKAKFQAVAESFTAAMGTPTAMAGPGSGGGAAKPSTTKGAPITAAPLQSRNARTEFYDRAYDILKSSVQSSRLNIRQEERGLVIQLGAQIFFESGSADLPEGSMDTFIPIAQMLAKFPNNVQIEGYSDDLRPGADTRFRSNWELSAQRALNVLQALQDLGVNPARLSAVAYGDSHPMVSNDTPEGRAYNREVNLVILYSPDQK